MLMMMMIQPNIEDKRLKLRIIILSKCCSHYKGLCLPKQIFKTLSLVSTRETREGGQGGATNKNDDDDNNDDDVDNDNNDDNSDDDVNLKMIEAVWRPTSTGTLK